MATIRGQNYRLTKHGRARFLERVDSYATDTEILQRCVDGVLGFKCIWKPEYNKVIQFYRPYAVITAWRLITVLSDDEE